MDERGEFVQEDTAGRGPLALETFEYEEGGFTPYMLYKDHANCEPYQENLGTIHSSNLCTESVEYTSPDEVAVCNLASFAPPGL